jgi:uncharacterized glyoxalase superfamily protein PhnB
MKIISLTPILYSKHLEDTIDFYEKRLGFNCLSFKPDLGWVCLGLDNIEIIYSKPNEKLFFEKSIFTGSFYFNIQNVEEFWNEIKNNVSICYPLEEFNYDMKEFAIYDNNGYILQFGQDLN